MMKNLFGDAFGRIAPENCRLTFNGDLAIKVANGYRAWNAKLKRLTNVTSFTFPVGGDFIFVIPTTKVKEGDIILHNARPKVVVSVDSTNDFIKVINYENGLAEEIVPERHIFMGKTYFFSKLVSLFGKNMFSGKGCQGIMKMMMLKEFMGGGCEGRQDPMMMLMMMGQNNDMFNLDLELGELEDNDDIEGDDEDAVVPAAKKAPSKKKK